MDVLVIPDKGQPWVMTTDEKGRVVRTSPRDPSVNIGRVIYVKSTTWRN